MNSYRSLRKLLIICSLMAILAGCSDEKKPVINHNQINDSSKSTTPINSDTVSKDTSSKVPRNINGLKTENLKFGPAPDIFQVNMNDIFDAYMSITYSLCFSDPKGVKTGTAIFKQMQERIDPNILTGEMKNYWNGYANELTEVISRIESANDIESQRVAYKYLSELMTVAIKNYRVKDKLIKKYECPQVLNGQGAYWYFEDSSAYTLMNPYLGQQSKDCLEPVETINYKK